MKRDETLVLELLDNDFLDSVYLNVRFMTQISALVNMVREL